MFDAYIPGGSLRSAGAGQLVVPRSKTKLGGLALRLYAAHCWNQLHMEIRSASTAASFKKKLKTALYQLALLISL